MSLVTFIEEPAYISLDFTVVYFRPCANPMLEKLEWHTLKYRSGDAYPLSIWNSVAADACKIPTKR